jgi:hypothetical protein
MSFTAPAVAEEFSACWVTTVTNPVTLATDQITRCRISGGDVVDYASDTSVPSRLYPNVGIDLNGDCWYLTSAVTTWVFVSANSSGEAVLGFDPDPGPGPPVVVTDPLPRCTTEPGDPTDPTRQVWDYVTRYIHPPPTPDVNPTAGDGVAGLPTYVGVPIPEVHETQIGSVTGLILDIHIEVSGVEIEWGDGGVDNFPASETALAGYPDGLASHVYEVKDELGYDLEISYNWTARWRIAGGEWESLAVPATTTAVVYPVAEIVSVITD